VLAPVAAVEVGSRSTSLDELQVDACRPPMDVAKEPPVPGQGLEAPFVTHASSTHPSQSPAYRSAAGAPAARS
jgi:hypothetical protein